MKKISSILVILFFLSCNKVEIKSSNHQDINKLETEICDCFEKNNGDEDEIMKCFELQDKYWNSIEDSLDRIEFLETTYKCIN